VADRDTWPDLPVLADALQHELDRLDRLDLSGGRSGDTVASLRRRVAAER
jgi:hypothetical protein